jgi:hypothetical protein
MAAPCRTAQCDRRSITLKLRQPGTQRAFTHLTELPTILDETRESSPSVSASDGGTSIEALFEQTGPRSGRVAPSNETAIEVARL